MSGAVLTTSATGYFALLLIGVTIALPYCLRRGTPPMRLHYVVGYIIAALVIVHMMISMSGRMAAHTSVVGLDIATLALLLIVGQIILGTSMARRSGGRSGLKRWHFALMLAIAILAIVHVVLNSPMLHGMFRM